MLKLLVSAGVRALGCRKGAAMVEYGILTALIALVGSVALTALGSRMATMFTSLAGSI